MLYCKLDWWIFTNLQLQKSTTFSQELCTTLPQFATFNRRNNQIEFSERPFNIYLSYFLNAVPLGSGSSRGWSRMLWCLRVGWRTFRNGSKACTCCAVSLSFDHSGSFISFPPIFILFFNSQACGWQSLFNLISLSVLCFVTHYESIMKVYLFPDLRKFWILFRLNKREWSS